MPIIAAFAVPHPPMIVPQVGRGSERIVQKTIDSYKCIAEEIAELRPETIVISSPHAKMYSDYFHISPKSSAKGSFERFAAPDAAFDQAYDEEFTLAVDKYCEDADFPAGRFGETDPLLDHGTMVPLFFINQKYTNFKLVRVGLSGMDLAKHYEFGKIIKHISDKLGRRTVYIASGDLSHKLKDDGPYGFAQEGVVYDDKIMNVFSRAAFGELFDFDDNFCNKAAECGHRSFVIMAGALDGISVLPKVYSHESVTGVGYGIASFYPQREDKGRCFLEKYLADKEREAAEKIEKSDDYVKLARLSLESYILRGETISVPAGLPPEMTLKKAGTFVSIHKDGNLRGCIGTIMPTQSSAAEEIIRNAISAAVKDPRFPPIKADELKYLDINVDVLGDIEPITSKSMLDVKRYGVIVANGGKQGLLLPDLDGVDTVDDQINIAMRKAGIPNGTPIDLYRFEVVRHE